MFPQNSLLSGWLLPTEPFSSSMWTAELIAFVGIFVSITIFRIIVNENNRQLDVGSSFLQTFSIFMLQPMKIV